MRAGALVALGIVAYAIFLAATLPASVAAREWNARSRSPLRVEAAQGTVWNGEARLNATVAGNVLTIERASWRFVPARLLAGRIAFDVRLASQGLAAHAEARRSLGAWEVRDLEAQGDAAFFAVLSPIAATWRLAGPVRLTAPALSIDGEDMRGALDAEWRDATSALSAIRPLGSYAAKWSSDGGAGRIVVTTLRGPLQFRGEGTTTAPLRISFSGEARADGEAAKALEPLLDLLGPRRPDGSRAIAFRID